MENASKALIMAGGMLIAGLLISLIVYAWSTFSEYQSSKDELKNIEDTAKFNEQFSNYDRKDVMGYELLSLINKVIDYNERMTEDTIHDNDDKYKRVQMTIRLDDEKSNNRNKLTYDGGDTKLFTEPAYYEGDLTAQKGGERPTFKLTIDDTIKDIRENFDVDENTLDNMARNIKSMFKTEEEIGKEKDLLKAGEQKNEETIFKIIVAKFNSYVKNHPLDYEKGKGKWDKYFKLNNGKPENENITAADGRKYVNVYKNLLKCYEYMQFKRGIFECTNIEYDTGDTGRVTGIKFKFTGNIK